MHFKAISCNLLNTVFLVHVLEAFRDKETWKGRESVKKILNGGGGLSTELARDASKFFPRAKLLSAYGGSFFSHHVPLYKP